MIIGKLILVVVVFGVVFVVFGVDLGRDFGVVLVFVVISTVGRCLGILVWKCRCTWRFGPWGCLTTDSACRRRSR